MFNPINGGDCVECPEGTVSSEDGTKCHPAKLYEKRVNMFDMDSMQRFDLMCKNLEFMHNCEGEDSKAIGPIKMDLNKSLHEQPIFYFTFDGPLQVDTIEFYRNKLSTISRSSFIYMLEPRKHLSVKEIQ